MRIVVIGASGNIGSRVLDVLGEDGTDHEVIGIARRPPMTGPLAMAARWVTCDISDPAASPVLLEACRGADAVIHLAWLIQSSHDEAGMRATNVDGTARLLEVLEQLGRQANGAPPALVAASSVGAYSPGPKDAPTDEDWPTDGVPSSIYSRHKVAAERLMDEYETRTGGRVVRIRPGVVFSDRAASSQARYFLGPFVPMTLLRRAFVPVVPAPPRLVASIVHSYDAGAAFVRAALRPQARGAFNIAADEPLSAALLADVLHARQVPMPAAVLRGLADLTWRLRLQPTDPGWVDLAFASPVMSTERARRELGWSPTRTAEETLRNWLDGMRQHVGGPSPVLRPARNALAQAVGALPTIGPRFGKRI